jgi:type I restriction enzyme S subunit
MATAGFIATLAKGIRERSTAFDAATLADVVMPCPPLEEQRRIADFLDEELAIVAAIQRNLERVLLALVERQDSSLAEVFESTSPRFQGKSLTSLPLRRVVSRWIDYRGATPEKVESGIPLVTARNVTNGRIDFESSREFISEDSYWTWMRRGFPKAGDVLLTTEAPLGQVAQVVNEGIALAQRVVLIRADDNAISSDWLYWYLQSPQGQRELTLRATGSTALGIKVDRLRGLPIPVSDQQSVRERLDWLGEVVRSHGLVQGLINRQLALLAERRGALVRAAVTGQIDVTTARGVDVS